MFRFVSKLLLSNALKLEEGEIKIYNTPVIMNPADYSVCLIHRLMKEHGYQKAHDYIYEGAKLGTQEYCKELRNNTTSRGMELANLYAEIVTMAGYGKAKITTFDQINHKVVCRFSNSPIAKRYNKLYGTSKYPIDIITNGLYAGSFNVLFNENNDALEVHCAAKGESYCEFVYAKPEEIKVLKKKYWG